MKHMFGLKRSAFEKNGFWFVLVLIVFLIHLLTSRYNELYHDAALYRFFAKSFNNNGSFSLFNYTSKLRGYFFPLLNYPITLFFGEGLEVAKKEIVAFKVLGALYAAAIFGAVVPKLWTIISGKSHLSWTSRLFFALSGFLFWRDYFNFPLSDFPALLVLFLALLTAYNSRNNLGGLIAGALSAAALYTRPIYILSIPFIIALMLYPYMKHSCRMLMHRAGLAIVLFATGFTLVAIPQILINYYNFNSGSILVISESSNYMVDGKPNLFLWQLNTGLKVQRYETNVGDDYPDAQVIFNDLSGQTMLKRSNISTLNSYYDYMIFVLERPLDMLLLYARHIFNGIDLLYTTPYLKNVHDETFSIAFFNYTYLFVAMLVIVSARKFLGWPQWLALGAILLPCAACIPLTMESRFLLPLHVLLCAIACFGWPLHWSWHNLARPQWIKLVSCYAVFLLICFMLSANTQATLHLATKIIQP